MITTEVYQRQLAEKMIRSFADEFRQKTGLRITINLDRFVAENVIENPCLSIMSLDVLKKHFMDSIPEDLQLEHQDVLTTRCRKRDLVDLRSMFCYIAVNMSFTLVSVARFIKRDHTTIIHLKKKAEDLLKTDPTYRTRYNHILENIKIKHAAFS